MNSLLQPVVVLTALNVEYRAVRQHLTVIRTSRHAAGTVFTEGHLTGSPVPVVLAVAGEGNQGAAILAERASSLYSPRALLLVGVAGGLKDDVRIGDVVVATRVYAYHGGREGEEGFATRPRSWDAPHELEQLARHLDMTGEWTRWLPADARATPPAVHFKPIAAGEVVLDSRDSPLARRLRSTFSDAAAIDLESAGVWHAGHLGSLPVLSIRGISDQADGRKQQADAGGSQVVAAANAAAFAVALIRAMSPDSARLSATVQNVSARADGAVVALTSRIFISHATQDPRDVDLARRIHSRIEASGAEAWIAPDSIPAAERWDEALIAGLLERATHFLVIVSGATVHSEQVRREVELAVTRSQSGASLRIMPLLVGAPKDPSWLKLLEPFADVPYQPDAERQLLEVVRAVGAELSPWVPQLPYVRLKTDGFVGRDFAFDQFNTFRDARPCGHIIVEGLPGVGKTSILAEATRRWNCPAHFNIHAQGISSAAAFLEGLHAQLSMRYELRLRPPEASDDGDGRYLNRLLEETADRLGPAEQLVIVVDALDEVNPSRPDLNPLFLPTALPAGLFLLVSRRSHTAPLQVDGDSDVVDLMANRAESRKDAEKFIRASLAKPVLGARLSEVADLESVVVGLLEHSQLNFMYLMYVLHDIEQGRMRTDDLRQLPYGLRGYYQRHWQHMRSGGARAALGLRTIYTLAKLRRPVTASLLASVIGVDKLDVLQLLEDWAQFLEIAPAGGTWTYSFYHQDFCDFLMNKETVSAAGIDLTEISSMIGRGLVDGLGFELDG